MMWILRIVEIRLTLMLQPDPIVITNANWSLIEKKWVNIYEYKYICIKLVHICWENCIVTIQKICEHATQHAVAGSEKKKLKVR